MTAADEKRRAEVIRLVELDSDSTGKFIESIVGRGFTIRGWGITVALALVGVGFDRRQWEIAALSVGVTVLFLWVDVQHTWLYTRALEHSQNLDRILGLYYASLTRGVDDPKPAEDLDVELDALRYGFSTNLERLSLRALPQLRARTTLFGIYGALAAISVAATLAIAVSDGDGSKTKFTCTKSNDASRQYECTEL